MPRRPGQRNKPKIEPPAYSQLKNTPWSIVLPTDPQHPSHRLRDLMNKAKRAALAVEDPLGYIRENWDKTLPGMWDLLLDLCIASGDPNQIRETLTRMTAMSGIAPRSKLEVSAGPEPDLSHLSDEEIAKLRGVVLIEGRTQEDEE